MTGAGEVEERVKEAVEGVWVWLLGARAPAIDGVTTDEDGNASPTEVVAGTPLKAGLALREEGDTDWLPLPAGTPETSGEVVDEEGSCG